MKCQKFPFWTGFKAMKVQTLTHRTISLLTDVVPNIFEGWKNNCCSNSLSLSNTKLSLLLSFETVGYSKEIWSLYIHIFVVFFNFQLIQMWFGQGCLYLRNLLSHFIISSVRYFFGAGSCKLPALSRKYVLALFIKNEVSWTMWTDLFHWQSIPKCHMTIEIFLRYKVRKISAN